MSMTFTCRSPEELKEKIKRFAQVFPDGVKQALWEQASIIMNESKGQVPVDTGFLRSTGYVNEPFDEGSKIAVEMGYYANYAAPVHDRPDPPVHHEVGKAFFLADPFEEKGPDLQRNIVARVEEMLGGE